MNQPRPTHWFAYRAILSTTLSILSLCTFALLLSNQEQGGPRPVTLLTVAWVGSAGAGVLLFLCSRRHESKWAIAIAGLFALATGLTLSALL